MNSMVFAFICGSLTVAVTYVEASPTAITYIAAPSLFRAAAYPYTYSAHTSSLVTPTQQQYHTQDGFGQYAYGYAEPNSAKQEMRSLDGTTHGTYSYRDAGGKLQIVDYTADDDGFHVAATNLPHVTTVGEPQVENQVDELTQQRAQQHKDQQPFRAAATSVGHTATTGVATTSDNGGSGNSENVLRLAEGRIAGSESIATNSIAGSVQLHQPVADTVAVATAKAAHLKRQEQEKQLHKFVQQGRSSFVPTIVSTIPRTVYSYGYPWRYYYY